MDQEESARVTDLQPDTYDGSRQYSAFVRNHFTSNSLSLIGPIMPDYIVGYGPPESTIAPPTMLSKEESELEGRGLTVPGWTKKSLDGAWSQFHPRPRRHYMEGYEATMESFVRGSHEVSGSGSDSGSARTVILDSVRGGEPVDEHKYYTGGGSGSSNSSTGTVRRVRGAG